VGNKENFTGFHLNHFQPKFKIQNRRELGHHGFAARHILSALDVGTELA
jgi:hypothetical protein